MQAINKVTDQYIEMMKFAKPVNGLSVWEKFNCKRVVSMAACVVDGHLIVGNRHFCPIMNMTIDNLKINHKNHDVRTDQGFVDQWGCWMSREEAWKVAKAAGQIKEVFTEGVLYSECYL